MRVWIDTDLGDNPDDALALLCAVGHPDIELVGVSTVRGDVRERAELVRALLDAVGAPVPLLYAGPPDPRALAAAEAVAAIGPLTNLAALARRGVQLPPLAVMGGVFEPPVLHRGARVDVDSNFAADPVAAAVVLAAANDVLLVPLDVTARLTLDDAHADRLARHVPILRDAMQHWRAAANAPICLHDPATLLALCGEHVVVGKRRVDVTATGALAVHDEAEHEIDVVVDVSTDDLVQRIDELVETATAPGTPAPSTKGD